jgi:hypothetical protein
MREQVSPNNRELTISEVLEAEALNGIQERRQIYCGEVIV